MKKIFLIIPLLFCCTNLYAEVTYKFPTYFDKSEIPSSAMAMEDGKVIGIAKVINFSCNPKKEFCCNITIDITHYDPKTGKETFRGKTRFVSKGTPKSEIPRVETNDIFISGKRERILFDTWFCGKKK